jgi:dephospho-CoA kinase
MDEEAASSPPLPLAAGEVLGKNVFRRVSRLVGKIMLRVGLTGGIACGKSLVAEFFRRRAIPVVNDDEAAREAVAKGTLGLAAVVAEFGEDVLLADGTLNRPELARRVFADDAKRRRLMAVTHPAIGRLLRQRFAEAEQSGARIIVYESALLVENGVASAWRPLVVVRRESCRSSAWPGAAA